MVVKLVSATGEETHLNVGVDISIGRDKKTCKICLPVTAEGVSRRHATLLLSAEGVLTLTDASSFGTFINGAKVNKSKTILQDGDRIRVGESWFSVVKKQPTSPALLVKPVDFKQPFKKNVVPKTKKSPIMSDSQRKMSDFFRPSQTTRSTLVLAEDTPYSQVIKKSPLKSETFVENTADAFELNSEIVIDDDDDDFCLALSSMKPKQAKSILVPKSSKGPTKPKTSVFSRHSTQNAFKFHDDSIQVLAADTIDYADSFPKENTLLEQNDIVVDTMLNWSETKNVTLAPDTCASQNAALNKSTNSQLYPGFPSNFAQPQVRKGVKRSVLYPMRNEPVSNISSSFTPSEPLPKKKSSLITMPTMVDDAVYQETITLSNPNISIFNTKEKPTSRISKRERKPFVEQKEEEDYSSASFTPSRDLLNSIYSGEKYEYEDDEEGSKYGFERKPQNIEVQSVVNKLDKMILFVDMERTENERMPSNVSRSIASDYSSCSGRVNFKKFRKASQGKFNNTRKSMSILGGSNDLVDFRSIRT